MTEQQTYTFDNIGPEEKEAYKGRYRVFDQYEAIDYPFAKQCDEMFSEGKRISQADRCYVLIHDFNLYSHGDRSAHYGNPDLPKEKRRCVGLDYRWVGLSVYEGFMLAMRYRFKGIFVYPFDPKGNLSKTPFFHVDWKDWDRPEGQTMFGYRDQNGTMVTITKNFDEVIRLIAMLPELMNSNGAD